MSRKLHVNVHLALLFTLLTWGSVAPEAPVADAAMRDDVQTVEALLHSGEDVNAAQGDGMTALHWAAENGNASMAEALLYAGANAEAVTRLGDYTPLHIAARSGEAPVIAVLLRAGADAEAMTSAGGIRPLHYAAASGRVEAVSLLVEATSDVDVREPMWDQTPLMFAAAAGRNDVVRALLAAGADPSITARVMDMDAREQEDRADRSRQSQLQAQIEAAREGRPPPRVRPERPAAQPQAAPDPAEPAVPTQEQLDNQQRDRVPSSRYSHAQLVGGYGGLTALHLAVRQGHSAVAKTLVENGADIDQQSGGDQTTPILMATINGHFDLALELFEAGADPTIPSHANATPLYAAINTQWIPKSRHPQPAHYMQQQTTYLELMRTLLEAGVDPNVRLTKQLWFTTFGDDYLRTDRMGATAFWRAAYALDIPAMRLLMEYGADPHIPTMKTAGRSFPGSAPEVEAEVDPSGLPPVPVGGPGVWAIHAASGVGYGEGFAANIHRVVPNGWLPAVRYLVEELGADVNARDHNGYTPVHHAAARGDDELIHYLVEKGADVTVVSRSGQTTVDLANGPVQRISPFPSTIALLESLGAKNNHNCVSC